MILDKYYFLMGLPKCCCFFQVMFGMPFGTEIDMWSLGCILAELYTGEALFYGTDKKEIMTEVFIPFKRHLFQ